jgi:uncharacterized protein (DUF39 family)
VSYEELLSGQIEINGKPTPTVPVSSLSMALEIAETLKGWIDKGEFTLTEAQERIVSE